MTCFIYFPMKNINVYFKPCPSILHADVDADADAGGIAIALLH